MGIASFFCATRNHNQEKKMRVIYKVFFRHFGSSQFVLLLLASTKSIAINFIQDKNAVYDPAHEVWVAREAGYYSIEEEYLVESQVDIKHKNVLENFKLGREVDSKEYTAALQAAGLLSSSSYIDSLLYNMKI